MPAAQTDPSQGTDLRYPVGPPHIPEKIGMDDRLSAMAAIAELPSHLRNAVHGFDAARFNTPYREGGWTVRQVIHHVADSHANALSRVKLALTEETPLVYAYNERAWAELPDSAAPPEWSLELIEAVHARWIMLLQSLDEAQWTRAFRHPERGTQTVGQATVLYAWHSRHHTAHITHLRRRMGW